jgi:hypothetical protein
MTPGGSIIGQEFGSTQPACSSVLPEAAINAQHDLKNSFCGQVVADGNEQTVPNDGFVFDQRPGMLDAARGLSDAPMVYGHRNDGEIWHVRVTARGSCILALSGDQARRLGRELIGYADLIDEGNAR